jgi:hypothetical protein
MAATQCVVRHVPLKKHGPRATNALDPRAQIPLNRIFGVEALDAHTRV